MQIAPRGATDPSTKDVPVVVERRKQVKRGPSRITLAIAVLVTLLSFGAMLMVLTGNWPPTTTEVLVPPTPVSTYVNGLQVETVGEPKPDGEQWIMRVRVTNNVKAPSAPQGTVTRDSPTPAPEPADLRNATIKVFYYDKPSTDVSRVRVGSGVGNVIDLKYGQTKETDVIATGVEEFCSGCYEAFPDTIWTDKDLVNATVTPAP